MKKINFQKEAKKAFLLELERKKVGLKKARKSPQFSKR